MYLDWKNNQGITRENGHGSIMRIKDAHQRKTCTQYTHVPRTERYIKWKNMNKGYLVCSQYSIILSTTASLSQQPMA
jgi:hypothetical protein